MAGDGGPARSGRPERPTPALSASGSLPRWIAEEIRATSAPGRGDRAIRAFQEAVELLSTDRPSSAVDAAVRAKSLAPRSGSVREILGIALYRAERFRDALRELQAYRRMTGRVDQNHLIADSYRAQGSPEKAVEPAREAMLADIPEEARAEAAVVGASALADLGRFTEALGMLRSFGTDDRMARPYQLRLWYVTGDVLERAGRTDEAAEEFRRVVRHDPDAFDAADRLGRLAPSDPD